MKITCKPYYTVTEPPARTNNNQSVKQQNAELRKKIRHYIRTMKKGNHFVVTGRDALQVSGLVNVQKDVLCIQRETAVRKLGDKVVGVWMME